MKKDVNYYMRLKYPMEINEDSDEGGYVISFPDLPGCMTSGETLEDAVHNADDAKKVWIEASLEEGIKIAEPRSVDDYSGVFKLRLPKSLHKSLAENSKKEGISMNQYCLYLLSQNNAYFSK